MSAKKLVRSPFLLGSNIRPGISPGGFSSNFRGGGKTNFSRKRASVAVVKAAAKEALQRHGFVQLPSEFDCTAKRRTR